MRNSEGNGSQSDRLGGEITLRNNGLDLEREQVDPRLSLLLRASALFDLVQAGLLDLDEALDAVAGACHAIRPCHCVAAMLQAWERYDRKIREDRLRNWRVRPAATPPWTTRRP